MVHHVYREKNGCLVRFSLLPGGAIKKAQVLGGKLRLMAFEWTHLACPKTVYERMVESMDVKLKFGKGAKEMKSLIVDQYGPWGESGWVHRGASMDEIKELFGPPATDEEKLKEWKMRYGDYRYSLKAVVKEGKFRFFKGDGWRTDGPAIEGTVSWVGEALEKWEDQEKESPLPAAKLEKYGRILEKEAPDKGARSRQYGNWVETAEKFVEAGGDRKLVAQVFVRIHRGTWRDYGMMELLDKEQKGVWFKTVMDRLWKPDEKGRIPVKTMPLDEVRGFANLLDDLKEHDEEQAKELLRKLRGANTGAGDLLELTLLEDWDAEGHAKRVAGYLGELSKAEPLVEEEVRVLLWHLYRREFEDSDLVLKDPQKVIDALNKLRPKLEKLGADYAEWADAIVAQLGKKEE
jgi:hypothetical protein